MANKKITALSALTSPASGDLLAVVDVSDTSEAASGTTKKIAVSDLVTGGVVPDDSVTNAKLANMAQASIKGRASGAGTGDPTDLTGTQATAILDAMVGDSGSGGTKGLAPAPASGDAAASKFLKADGTWAVPAGGSGSPGGSSGDIQYNDGAGGFAGAPIKRADANTINHYNGTGETATRYNFFTNRADASNYDQLAIYYHTANDQWWIDTTKAGTGTTRTLSVAIAGVEKWRFLTNGELQGKDSTNSKIALAAGSVSSPSVQFSISGTNTGFYNPTGSDVAVTNGGNYMTRFHTGGIMTANNGMFTFSSTGLGSGTTADVGLARQSAGVLEVNNGTAGQRGVLLLRGMTFAQLPGSPIAGMEATITDCNTTTWGATAAGGGANTVRVWYNGANWKVIGI